MKKKLQITTIVIALTAIAQATFAVETTRTLVPVAKPLDEIHGIIKQVLERTDKDLEEARKALRLEARALAEMLENLAEEAKRLEQESKKLGEKIGKQNKADVEAAKDLLARQEKLNDRINNVKRALRRDADAQDMTKKANRERARDADDAVAMLEDPPRNAKNALEESTANKAPKEQQQSLDTAAKEQKKLADNLKQLAEHYKNLEDGKGDKTRAGLRDQEEKLGIKEGLDQQYDMEQTAGLHPGQMPQNDDAPDNSGLGNEQEKIPSGKTFNPDELPDLPNMKLEDWAKLPPTNFLDFFERQRESLAPEFRKQIHHYFLRIGKLGRGRLPAPKKN